MGRIVKFIDTKITEVGLTNLKPKNLRYDRSGNSPPVSDTRLNECDETEDDIIPIKYMWDIGHIAYSKSIERLVIEPVKRDIYYKINNLSLWERVKYIWTGEIDV